MYALDPIGCFETVVGSAFLHRNCYLRSRVELCALFDSAYFFFSSVRAQAAFEFRFIHGCRIFLEAASRSCLWAHLRKEGRWKVCRVSCRMDMTEENELAEESLSTRSVIPGF